LPSGLCRIRSVSSRALWLRGSYDFFVPPLLVGPMGGCIFGPLYNIRVLEYTSPESLLWAHSYLLRVGCRPPPVVWPLNRWGFPPQLPQGCARQPGTQTVTRKGPRKGSELRWRDNVPQRVPAG